MPPSLFQHNYKVAAFIMILKAGRFLYISSDSISYLWMSNEDDKCESALSDPSNIDSGLSDPVSEAPESSWPSERPPPLLLLIKMAGFSAKAWLNRDSALLLFSLKGGGVKGDSASPSKRRRLLPNESMLLLSFCELSSGFGCRRKFYVKLKNFCFEFCFCFYAGQLFTVKRARSRTSAMITKTDKNFAKMPLFPNKQNLMYV